MPTVIKLGTVINDVGAHEDMLPTLLAAGGPRGDRLPALAGRPPVPAGAGLGVRGELAAKLQGVPVTPEASQLRH